MGAIRHTAIAAVVTMLCSGCAYVPEKEEVDNKHTSMDKSLSKRSAEIVPTERKDREFVTHVTGNWLGVKVTPLAQEATLPAAFRMPVTLKFPGRVNLRTIAERITKVTGIPVALKPDVFMPLSSFVGGPNQQGAAAAPGGAATGGAAAPTTASLSTSSFGNTTDDMELSFVDTPLAEVLNQINSRFGINYTYQDNEGIVFSRLVTRTMNVKANPGGTTLTASLGKGSSGGAASAGFQADGKVSMDSSFSIWTAMQNALDTIKSPVGKFYINQATGTVTMTDTKEVVDTVQRYIDSENVIMSKQVGVRVELLSVSSNDNNEVGVNWNGVFTKLNGLIPEWSLNVITPSSMSSAMAGGIGMSIIKPPTAGSTLSAFNGTQAMIDALQGFARVTDRQSFAAITLNRQPAPLAKTTQKTFLARTVPGGNAGTGSSTLPGLEPGQVTTGFLSNIVPTVQDNDTVMLQFSIDSSFLKKLDVQSTGSGATLQSIQTPEVDAVQTVQRVALKSGATLVLTGFEREVMQYDQRGLTKHVGLGGSYKGQKVKETIVILVTPIIVDGA